MPTVYTQHPDSDLFLSHPSVHFAFAQLLLSTVPSPSPSLQACIRSRGSTPRSLLPDSHVWLSLWLSCPGSHRTGHMPLLEHVTVYRDSLLTGVSSAVPELLVIFEPQRFAQCVAPAGGRCLLNERTVTEICGHPVK